MNPSLLCIISSGTENLSVIKLCQQENIAYEVILDSVAWPYDDRDHDYLLSRVQQIITSHKQKTKHKCRYIVSPSIELGLSLSYGDFSQTHILPLYSYYLEYCLTHSRSGKIGFLGGYSDLADIEDYVYQYSKNYSKSDYQAKTKKFTFPFALWTKEVNIWNYFLRLLSPRQIFINKIVKKDLKYLKDANVDTIIPLQYSYFRFQRTIQGFFNQKKQSFHNRSIIQTIFKKIISLYHFPKTPNGQSTKALISHIGSLHLIQGKKRESILSAGGKYEVDYESIDLK